MLNLHWRMAGAGKETGDSSVKSLAPVWHGTAPRLPQFAISGPFARVGCDTLQRHNAKTQSWLKPVLFGQCWQKNRSGSSTTDKRCSRRTQSAKVSVTAAQKRVMVTNVSQAVAFARLTQKKWKHQPVGASLCTKLGARRIALAGGSAVLEANNKATTLGHDRRWSPVPTCVTFWTNHRYEAVSALQQHGACPNTKAEAVNGLPQSFFAGGSGMHSKTFVL